MKTTMEKITPKVAEEYLKSVDPQHQRKMRSPRVDAFKRAMIAGHWYPNHQGIAFDDHGRLIDGQHRLEAVRQSGVTLTMLVTRGIASEMVNGIRLYAIDTIDTGYRRETGEQLSLRHNVENGTRVAAATRAILWWATGLHKNTTALALEILGVYPSIKKLSSGKKTKTLPSPIVGCFAVVLKSFPGLLDAFVNPYITGAGLVSKSPALLLRNLIINNSSGGEAALQRFVYWAFNAAKACALKEDIKVLRNNPAGALFFAQQQKGLVRKIRAAAGLAEN